MAVLSRFTEGAHEGLVPVCTIVTSTDPTTKTKKTIVVKAPSCEFMRVASEENGISFEKMSSRSAFVLFFKTFSLARQDEWSCSAALHLRRFTRRGADCLP